MARSREELTIPDLVLLSLLAERPLHGYEAKALLEFRQIGDWAGVSKPQIYYSLEKLTRLGCLHEVPTPAGAEAKAQKPGPDRYVFATTPKGRAELSDALEREAWAQQMDRPAFLTWLALSWQCRVGVVKIQMERRQRFLKREHKRKNQMLSDVVAEVGHRHHEAVWMLGLTIQQIETELSWLKQVKRELPRRASAVKPHKIAGSDPIQ